MSVLEELANDLAIRALAAERGNEDTIVDDVSKSIGDMSPTLQEAYQTMVRLHRAAARGQEVVDAHLAKHGLRPAKPKPRYQAPQQPVIEEPAEAPDFTETLAATADVADDIAEPEAEQTAPVLEVTEAPVDLLDPPTAPDNPVTETADAPQTDLTPAPAAIEKSKAPERALLEARRLAAEAEEAEKRAEKAKAEARALRGDHLSMIDALIEGSDDTP